MTDPAVQLVEDLAAQIPGFQEAYDLSWDHQHGCEVVVGYTEQRAKGFTGNANRRVIPPAHGVEP